MTKLRAQQDYPRSQGGAAIGARLRRLSERLDREAEAIYAQIGVEFEQRWFGVLNQISSIGPMTVGELADALGITHAAVSQTRSSLLRRGLIVVEDDDEDARRRLITLSSDGRRLVKRLVPLWAALNDTGLDLDREAGGLAAALDRLETALDARSLKTRVRAKLK